MYRLAARLKQPDPYEMMQNMPSSVFTEWLAYLDCELNEHTKQDYYLAQISAQVSKGLRGGNARLKDYLIMFTDPEQKHNKSKEVWQSVTGKKTK